MPASTFGPRPSATPVVLVTGVDPQASAAATIALQWEVPGAVVVEHRIDVVAQTLHRTVSDVTGVLERERIDLAHVCVSCAVREDIVPTLLRLAGLERWATIVAHLPVATEAHQVCRVVELEGHADIRVATVVAALDGPTLVDTLTGDDLLAELEHHTSDDDRRGVAETAGSLVEYADVVTVHGEADPAALDLVQALARPGVLVVTDADAVPAPGVLLGLHDHASAEVWTATTRRGALPAVSGDGVWRLDLRADRPFHPGRLREQLARLGGGPHRSRGCFWLPTRPDLACGWDGAGGQLSFGPTGEWGRSERHTRIVVTGLTSLTSESERAAVRAAFSQCLLTDAELAARGWVWEVGEDGYEPWLGPIRLVA